ncbi:hypothetical protein NEISICOT_01765 [Neisseria sicca ATCC 29256]|uniref:Uncharacterized protein n=1 Tax=Neisseria sicca ATCC 29256 TaxID=547045 RepID=C6M5G6_NEISI|nr:hypothetical protein NEISICOT_01765 [Neisseria sicca ATCC 29256]
MIKEKNFLTLRKQEVNRFYIGLTLNQYGVASPWLKENDSLRC